MQGKTLGGKYVVEPNSGGTACDLPPLVLRQKLGGVRKRGFAGIARKHARNLARAPIAFQGPQRGFRKIAFCFRYQVMGAAAHRHLGQMRNHDNLVGAC